MSIVVRSPHTYRVSAEVVDTDHLYGATHGSRALVGLHRMRSNDV